MDALGQMCDLA